MDQLMIRVIEALCDDVGTPRAAEVKALVQRGEWSQLLKLRTRAPSEYANSSSYWKDALVTELLRKCKLPTGIDTREVAVKTFWACESQNATTNVRLSRFLPSRLFIESEAENRVFDFIVEVRKEISGILGTLPSDLTPRFSGGATYADAGMLITTPDKMSSAPTITQGGRALLPLWGETAWSRALVKERPWISDPVTVRGNKFFTVPKDGEKDRGCCKEPSINVCYQLDVGRAIRTRLRRIGIDLNTGQDLHRDLAQLGSITGDLATIDMSNASDTLCRVLPELVLPDLWHDLLDSLRSKRTWIDGKWVLLEKFSSMGNGFTFELETLIFSALSRCVIRRAGGDPDSVRCYGDDLIVPAAYYREVTAALAYFGFTPNMKKTFAEGPFRESCGGDFWNGAPVRAHYLKELPDEPQQWIALANGLRRVAFADAGDLTRWDCVRRAWLRCLDPLPSHIRRCVGPQSLGDLVIHDDESRWTLERHGSQHSSHEPCYVRAYVPVPLVLPWHHWTPAVQLASCTLGYPADGVTPRGGVSGYRVRLVSILTGRWEPKGESVRYTKGGNTYVRRTPHTAVRSGAVSA